VLSNPRMTIDAVRKLYDAQPFTPFVIHLADGRKFPVRHREFMALEPAGRTVFVYQPDETFDLLDIMLITGLRVNPRHPKNGQR
jgi:hypothetical protein